MLNLATYIATHSVNLSFHYYSLLVAWEKMFELDFLVSLVVDFTVYLINLLSQRHLFLIIGVSYSS